MKTDSVLLLVLASMVPCHVMADSSTTTINVKATGQVVVPSDLLVLQLLVEIDRADVQEAKDENDRITTRLYELAKSQEIPRPRLLNTGLRFGFGRESSGKRGRGDEKNEPYDEAESGKPSILISRDLEVRFDNLPQAVRFLSEIVKWDSVGKTHELRLMPMRVEVADRKSPSLEARRRAVESAREKATLLAEQTGRRLETQFRSSTTCRNVRSPFRTIHSLTHLRKQVDG